MGKGRLEAFSDGVIAIIITIMVLELKVPHASTVASLAPLLPIFVCYVLSFVYLGIYWNNHHHMLHIAKRVNGKVLWANLHLLFWLSLVPFATAWLGENHISTWPVVVYGFVLIMGGVAYYILSRTLIGLHGKQSPIAMAIGEDKKGIVSVVIYFIGITLAFFQPWLGILCYSMVAAMWLIPDRRIEKKLVEENNH